MKKCYKYELKPAATYVAYIITHFVKKYIDIPRQPLLPIMRPLTSKIQIYTKQRQCQQTEIHVSAATWLKFNRNKTTCAKSKATCM